MTNMAEVYLTETQVKELANEYPTVSLAEARTASQKLGARLLAVEKEYEYSRRIHACEAAGEFGESSILCLIMSCRLGQMNLYQMTKHYVAMLHLMRS